MIKKLHILNLGVIIFSLLQSGSVLAATDVVQSRYEAYTELEHIIEMYNSEQYFEKSHNNQIQNVPVQAQFPYQDNQLEDVYLRVYNDIEDFPKTQTKLEFMGKYGRSDPEIPGGIEKCDANSCTFTGQNDAQRVAIYLNELADQKQMLTRNIDFGTTFVLAKYINLFNDGDSGNSGYDYIAELTNLENSLFTRKGTGFLKDSPAFSGGNIITINDFFKQNSGLVDTLLGKKSLSSIGSIVSTDVDKTKKVNDVAGTLKTALKQEAPACLLNPELKTNTVDLPNLKQGIAEKLVEYQDSAQALNAFLQLSQGFKQPLDTYPNPVGATSDVASGALNLVTGGVGTLIGENNIRTFQENFNKNACIRPEAQAGPDGKKYFDALADICAKLEFVFSSPKPADYGLVMRPLAIVTNFDSLKNIANQMNDKNNMTRSYPRAVFDLGFTSLELTLIPPRFDIVSVPIFSNLQPSQIFTTDTLKDAKKNIDSLSDKISLILNKEDYSENITTYTSMIEQYQKENEQTLENMKKTALVRSYLESVPIFQKLIGAQLNAMTVGFEKLKKLMKTFDDISKIPNSPIIKSKNKDGK